MTIMPQIPSTRWCPTPEQLMILEEMYRSGVRTPNAPLIQQITAHLSYYGRIEGKNVFYWFQNHKARDRQKLRRRLSRQHQLLFSSAHQLHYLQEQTAVHPLLCTFSNAASSNTNLIHHQDARQGLDLIQKLETGSREELSVSTTSTAINDNNTYNYELMMMMDMMNPNTIAPCYRPLKTLDLFPTTSTGSLKDEYCSTSKSSSSTSNS